MSSVNPQLDGLYSFCQSEIFKKVVSVSGMLSSPPPPGRGSVRLYEMNAVLTSRRASAVKRDQHICNETTWRFARPTHYISTEVITASRHHLQEDVASILSASDETPLGRAVFILDYIGDEINLNISKLRNK